MVAVAKPISLVTPKAYLDGERAANDKHEFLDGQIYAMSGGSPEHSMLAMSIGAELRQHLKGKPCRTFNSDLKVGVQGNSSFSFFYPDVTVLCGDARFHDEQRDVLMNPLLVVEVLSPTTEAFDRGKKFRRYQQIGSLQTYLLVSQDEAHIDHFERQEDNSWSLRSVSGVDQVLVLSSLGITLALSEIYEGI